MKMNTLTAAILILCGAISAPIYAGVLVPVATDTLFVPAGASSNETVKIAFKLTNKNALASNTFLSNEPIKAVFSITVAAKDVGQPAHLFMVARYNNSFYMLTANNSWQTWNGELSTLATFKTKTLDKQESVEVLNNQTLPAGEFLLYTGYSRTQDTGDTPIFYNATPASFMVFDAKSPALHPITDKSVLTALFERGSQAYKGQSGIVGGDALFSPAFSPAPTPSASSSGSSATSQTNIQEIGVDESDRIKVDGDKLFALEACAADSLTVTSSNKQCINAYRMIEKPASSSALGALSLGNDTYQDALYSVQTSAINTRKQLVYIGSSMQQSIFDGWFSPWYWGNNKTEIKFLDVTDPAAMQIKSTITLNTTLLSSRVVDNVLYVVTRKNPHFTYPTDPAKPIVLGSSASPLIPSAVDDSIQILPYVPPTPVGPPKIDIAELLPTISINGEKATPLVNATDCYVPAQSSDTRVDNTLITITAIPLTAPSSHYSVCIAGNVDTFYMSTQALYLATSRYPYQISGNQLNYDAKQEVMTELHKFKLAKNALIYGGSGVVPGHLGWAADKQPFRMGENDGILKVATSRGQSWTDNSTTRVSVLQEDTATKTLKEIGFLDNLGKPGEQLYAARFIQNRGYLVTFKTTDPLYVLDFSVPAKPEIMGELQVNGYSDYLHPIGDNYLLGIGKDAIVDTTTPASNNPFINPVTRGAWYQGVKLSLFDVSSKATLREIESVVIGKRGTESGALYDHHALAWLATGDSKGTLAIPIQLNNNLLPSSQLQYYANTNDYYNSPSAYYDWTHTGLYTFTIDATANPAIKLNRRLIANVNDPLTYNNGMGTYNDRAVIQGNTLHYVHDNRVLSADITAK